MIAADRVENHGMSLRTSPARLARLARLASFAAGMLPVAAFPGPGQAWLAWVALVPAMLLMCRAPDGREAAVRGWWFGAGFILAAMYWLVPSIGPALLVLAVLFGAVQGVFGYAVWRLLHRPAGAGRAALALLVLPAVWVSCEFVRSWHVLGGPWALLGASQWEHPAVLALASVGGVWLVSAAVAACNTAVVLLCTARSRVVPLTALLAVAVAGPTLFATLPAPPPGGSAAVALVQPGQTPDAEARLAASVRITRGLVGQRPDLVVWAESSTTADLDTDTAVLDGLRTLSATTGAQLLVGEDARKADGRISKDAVLVTPDGVAGRYRKIRLVPFGEYIPLRAALGWIAGVSKAAGENRAPGTSVHLLPVTLADGTPLPVGALICFESAFPDMSRTAARAGAPLIVYQSSTSTFQSTWAPAQHASLGAIRAAETGRPVVQAALTGESVAYDRQGRRLARLGTDTSGAVTVRVPLADPTALTWYDRLGDWVPYGCVVITAGGAAVLLVRRRRATAGGDAAPASAGRAAQPTRS